MRSRPWRRWWRSAWGADGERRPGMCVPLPHPYHRSGTARWRRGAALHLNTIPACRGVGWRATIYFCPPASIAASTFGGDIGSSVSRRPVARSIALAMAAIGGQMLTSAAPLAPYG